MSDRAAFTDPDSVASMEAEHLPLWRAFIRVFSHLLRPGVRILDFGCSRGGLLFLVCREGAEGTISGRPSLGIGIDVDTPAMRRLLAESAEINRGRYPLAFTTSGPGSFPGQFDLVISHEVVYLLPDLKRTFAEIGTALVPGGHFSLATGCHNENPLFTRWRASFKALGITAFEYSVEDYEAALRASGFGHIQRDRLLLSRAEYDAWVQDRESAAPNPAWFPGPADEESYYTKVGKTVITAQRS